MTHDSILDLIGDTPVIRLKTFDTGVCELYVKLENLNPGGSIKDRMAFSMIQAAEKEGKLKTGDTIIEATAGNTGIALAMVGSQRDYKVQLVVPDKMSQEKIQMLQALGATVTMTRSDVEKGHPEYYQDLAESIAADTPNSFYINQFNNPANLDAHYRNTAPEIWKQMDGKVDAIVCGVGSGGTISGLSKYFQEVAPNVEIVLADPEGSILVDYIEKGEFGSAGSWLIEGIGEDFIPELADLSKVKKAYTISDEESLKTAREALSREGIFAGSSSGTLIAAAMRYCQEQTTPKKVLTFICDRGSNYLSKMYNDYWMQEQGYLEKAKTDDLRDIISRHYNENEVVIAKPDDTLATVHSRMKLYSFSQLPVMEAKEVLGIISEEDILLASYKDINAFTQPAKNFMSTKLETLSPSASIDAVMDLIKKNFTPIIKDKNGFYG